MSKKSFTTLSILAMLLSCSHDEGPVDQASYALYVIEDQAEALGCYLPLDDSLLETVPTGATPNFLFGSGDRLYLVNSGFTGSPSLGIYQASAPAVLVGQVPLPPGSNPYAGDVLGDTIYVSGLLTDQLYIITGDSLVDSVGVGKAPEGVLCFNDRVYVVCTGYDFNSYTTGPGALYVYDPTSQTMDSLGLGINPQWCVLDDQAMLHVLITGDYAQAQGAVVKIDPTSLRVVDSVSIPGHSPGAIAIGGDFGYVVGWDGTIISYGVNNMTVLDSLVLGSGISGIAWETNGLWLTRYSNSQGNYLIKLQGLNVEDSVGLGSGVGAKAPMVWTGSGVARASFCSGQGQTAPRH